MKLITKGKVLFDAFSRVQPAQGNYPINQHALLEVNEDELCLTATDNDTTIIETVAQAEGTPFEVPEEGEACLPIDWTLGLLTNLKDRDVTLEVKDRRATLKAGKSGPYRTGTMPPDDFPVVPEVHGEQLFRMEQFRLREILHLTSFAVSDLESDAALRGILFEFGDGELHVVATNKSRLSLVTDKSVGDWNKFSVVVPCTGSRNPVKMLHRLLGNDGIVTAATDGSALAFSVAGTRLVTRTLSGQFPNWKLVTKIEHEGWITCNRKALLAAVKNVMHTVPPNPSDGVHYTRYDVSDGVLCVSSRNNMGNEGRDEIEVSQNGSDATFALQGNFMIDALGAMSCESVRIGIPTGPRSIPAFLTRVDDGAFLHAIWTVSVRE